MSFLTRNKLFAAIFVVTFLCFSPSLANKLLGWDDAGYIIENTNIRSLSMETFRWAFGSVYLNYWAPLTWLSLAVDYAIWGTNPAGYHLTNNVLHALNAGIFFLISHELIEVHKERSKQDGRLRFPANQALCCAALAAVFFAIHPLRVESAAWATERKDVLALFLGLVSILFYLRHAYCSEGRGKVLSPFYWWSLAFFLLSLCSKSMMVTLPIVLLVLDWFPFGRFRYLGVGWLILEKLPYFLFSAVVSLVTMRANAHVIEPIDWYTRLLNACKSVAAYLYLTLWPTGVSPFYVHPFKINGMTMDYFIPIIVLGAITICCILTMKRMPVLMAAWLIYLAALLPSLGITQQVGAQAMAARYMYFPGLSLALVVALGVTVLYARNVASRPASLGLGIVVGLILTVNTFLTVRDIAYWKDDVTLWTRVIELSPNTGRAYFQRSRAYRLKGDYPNSLSDMERAISIAAGKRYRAMYELYRSRAAIYAEMGEFASVVADYSKALETATGGVRQMTIYQRGLAYQRLGKVDLANEDFRESGGIVTGQEK